MGINYVPRRADGSNVIRDKYGVVIEVLPEFEGSHFSFTFKTGKPIGKKISGKFISLEHFIGMRNQSSAIYWKSINDRFDHAPLHERIWPKEEAERLNKLLEHKCVVMPNGSLEIERLHNGKIVDMPYEDIDSAIRAQYHTIENYRSELENNPKMLKEINRKIDYISNRLDVLSAEKKQMLYNIANAVSVMNEMLASDGKFFRRAEFGLRLKEVKQYLNSVWLNFLGKQAKRCLSILKDIDVDDNPRRTLRSAINSLETKEINGIDLIRSLARVSKQKNKEIVFKETNSLLPKNCLKRTDDFVNIFSLLDIAKKLKNETEITLNKICLECERKRHCPYS